MNNTWIKFSLGSCLAAVVSLSLSLWLADLTHAQDDLRTKRFVSKDNPPKVNVEHFVFDQLNILGEIQGSYKKNKYLTTNDVIYLRIKNPSVSVGDRFSIFQELGSVKDKGKKIGHKIMLKGFVEVTRVLPTSIVGKIYDAKLDIELGDKLAAEVTPATSIDPQEPANDLRGRVVGETNTRPMIGAYDFVYINKGESEGLKLNDSLDVIRTADGAEALTPGLPEATVAKMVVVQMAQHSSVAYVIAASDKFEAGAAFKTTHSDVKYLENGSQAPMGDSGKSPQPQ